MAIPSSLTPEAIQAWLAAQVEVQLRLAPGSVDPHAPLAGYGIDSLSSVLIVSDLDSELGLQVSESLLWEYPTLAAAAVFLAAEAAAKAEAAGA